MNSSDLLQSRYDFFLIWGHGLEYKKEIIKIITSNDNFEIKRIHNHKIKNMKKFVKKVYEYDYVPYFHLRGKTKYLLTTPKEVMFIFVKNKSPREIWKLGHGTGHIESEVIVEYKNIIRNKFNEKKDDRRTENHVIHASDNEIQVHHILKYLGYNEGVKLFNRHMNKPVKIPYFIKQFNDYQIKEIYINNLVCNIVDNNQIKRINIEESFQYKFLLGYEEEYENYIDRYQGYQLKAYYDLKKYKKNSKNFDYLSKGYNLEYIVVKKIDNNHYIILDGLHRASIIKKQGYKKIIVMEIL
jgi:hypothetical protein